VEQGLVIEQIAEGPEGLDAQAWRRGITYVAARKRIEHPRGNGHLKAIPEFNNQAIRGLTS
jgi:hypothetical protein